MTEHDQRIAIAEWMGILTDDMRRALVDYRDDGRPAAVLFTLVPDYTRDLNAMHSAEQKLTRDQCFQYGQELAAVLLRLAEPGYNFTWHATAAQRCEALLRTLNLWRDDPPTPLSSAPSKAAGGPQTQPQPQ